MTLLKDIDCTFSLGRICIFGCLARLRNDFLPSPFYLSLLSTISFCESLILMKALSPDFFSLFVRATHANNGSPKKYIFLLFVTCATRGNESFAQTHNTRKRKRESSVSKQGHRSVIYIQQKNLHIN